MKTFAANAELKELYEKVVPPVSKIYAISDQMERDLATIKEVVQQFDINLC
jgi:hypothetical protein